MKSRDLFLFFIFFFAATPLFAQTQMKAKLDEKSIVKDSTGRIWPYAEWAKAFDAGEYGLKPVDPNDANSAFILVKLSNEERELVLKHKYKPKETPYFTTGESISGFSTKDINGNKIKINDLKGKVVVMNFWFINCPPCRKEIPFLNELVEQYKDSTGVVFIGIALDSKSELREFLKKEPFNYTIIDNGRFITGKYGITAYPTHLVLDKEGKVYFHTYGFGNTTVEWIQQSIAELMQ